MTSVEEARSAFQKYRKQRKADGFVRKPSYRTAFYSGYLAASTADDGKDAEIARLRDETWLAAIVAIKYMAANWDQGCRSLAESEALQKAAESLVDELRTAAPSDYIDMKLKGAEHAVAAEQKAAKAEALIRDLVAALGTVENEVLQNRYGDALWTIKVAFSSVREAGYGSDKLSKEGRADG